MHRFKKLKISTLSLLLIVVNNKDKYKANSEIHSINTRQNSNFNLSNDPFHIFVSLIMRSFKAHTGRRAWKVIENGLLKPCYLSRGDHNRKIRTRKQQMLVNIPS